MSSWTKRWIAFSGVLGLIACLPVEAKECDPSTYPQVLKAIRGWETRTDYKLTQATTVEIQNSFCVAAEGLIAEKKAGESAIDASAFKVIEDFLDREKNPGAQSRSLGSVLRTQFGAAGFSRPQVKRLVTVAFSYTRDVDGLIADGERFPRVKALLLPDGRRLIQAVWNGNVVCSQQLELKTGVNSEFSC